MLTNKYSDGWGLNPNDARPQCAASFVRAALVWRRGTVREQRAVRIALRDLRWRPYRVERTGSLPTSEVKRRRARLVLGWGTAREDLRVLPAFPQGPQGML